jgi:predicted MFS family arabinose efflux permease
MPPLLFACLVGLQQIVCWGTLTYAAAVYAPAMAAQTGISVASLMTAYGAGLLVNAVLAPGLTRWVMRVGALVPGLLGLLLTVMACMTLSVTTHWAVALAGFMLSGAAMALTQYDFAFLTVKLHMPRHARKVVAVITFFGALASTIMWPVALALASAVGTYAAWRYLALITVLVSLPAVLPCYRLPRVQDPVASAMDAPGATLHTLPTANSAVVVACIIGLAIIGTSVVANLPLVLTQMQVSPAALATLLPLFGIGQLAARALDFVGSRWVDSTGTLVASVATLLAAMALSTLPHNAWWVSAAFVFLLGAGNGLATILRGVLPQQLFTGAVFAAASGQLASIGAFSRALMPVAVAHVVVLAHGVAWMGLIYAGLTILCGSLLMRQLKLQPAQHS